MRASTNSANRRQLMTWLTLAVAVAAVAMLLTGGGVAEGQGDVAPTFGSETIPVQTYAVNTAISTLTLPPATGGNGTLTYSLAPTLPNGLSFDPGNRQITGTPTTAQAATLYTYKVVDSDTNTAGNDAETLTLTITVEATTRCTDNDVSAQQSKSVPGSSFDLTFEFSGNCQPEGYREAIITVVLDEAIGVPAGFDRGDVIIIATGRYYSSFVSAGTTESDDHEIEVAGCGQWRYSLSDNNNVGCSESENLRSIQLRGLTLPNRPAADPNEGYPVSIQWGNNRAFTGKIGVDATLKVNGDKLVGFGESIKFEGSGFSDGVYRQPLRSAGYQFRRVHQRGRRRLDQHRFHQRGFRLSLRLGGRHLHQCVPFRRQILGLCCRWGWGS